VFFSFKHLPLFPQIDKFAALNVIHNALKLFEKLDDQIVNRKKNK